MFDTFRAFRDDERAIEGLPIRLVIAIVVGVASTTAVVVRRAG